MVRWIGGAPSLHALDRSPQHHPPVTIPQPPEWSARDRASFDALVFDAYDSPTANPTHEGETSGLPLDLRHTLVARRSRVAGINNCIQSADHTAAGQRLAEYADTYWSDRELRRYTGVGWGGRLEVGRCDSDPPDGWLYIREERDSDEVRSGWIAHTASWRERDHNGILGRWVKTEIIIDRDFARDDLYPENVFEKMLAHELGDALALYHVAPGQGFVMTSGHPATWPVAEQLINQTAFEVGPSVIYPGVVPPAPVPALPLAGLLLLVVALLWSARRRMAQDGRV